MNEYVRAASAWIYIYLPRGQLVLATHTKFLLPVAGLSLVLINHFIISALGCVCLRVLISF